MCVCVWVCLSESLSPRNISGFSLPGLLRNRYTRVYEFRTDIQLPLVMGRFKVHGLQGSIAYT